MVRGQSSLITIQSKRVPSLKICFEKICLQACFPCRTFHEITFIIIQKLIMIETTPDETMLLMVLGIISTMFLLLVVHIRTIKKRWENPET